MEKTLIVEVLIISSWPRRCDDTIETHITITILNMPLSGTRLHFDRHVLPAQRYIFLDGQLVMYTAAAVYAMVRFTNLAHRPFTLKWWFWLAATGVNIGLALRCAPLTHRPPLYPDSPPSP
jgi:hypothetical protein